MELEHDNADAPAQTMSSGELKAAIAAALAAYDKPTAVRTAVEAVTSDAVDIATLYREVLTPLLAETGAGWQAGEVHVWQEHLASACVRTVVEILYPGVLKAKASVPASGRSVLLASPPEEGHDLGLRMVCDRFDMAGWTTHFLGADTPLDDIVAAARELGVGAVVLSSSTHFHRLHVRHAVDRLKAELPGVSVWVGGPAFALDRSGWSDDELLDLEALLGPQVAPKAPENGEPSAGTGAPAEPDTPAAGDVAPIEG